MAQLVGDCVVASEVVGIAVVVVVVVVVVAGSLGGFIRSSQVVSEHIPPILAHS
jgi:hypothetical protein